MLELNQNPSERIWMLDFGCHPITQYSASYSFWGLVYSWGNDIGFQWAFSRWSVLKEKKIKERRGREGEKKIHTAERPQPGGGSGDKHSHCSWHKRSMFEGNNGNVLCYMWEKALWMKREVVEEKATGSPCKISLIHSASILNLQWLRAVSNSSARLLLHWLSPLLFSPAQTTLGSRVQSTFLGPFWETRAVLKLWMHAWHGWSRLTTSRLEKRLRQTFRLELVSLDSSQIALSFCNTGDGNPKRTRRGSVSICIKANMNNWSDQLELLQMSL